MVIVAGKVWTFLGPIPVEELKVGDLILDRHPSARKLLGVYKEPVKKVLKFKHNGLVVSADAEVYTIYGPKKVTEETELCIRKEDNSTVTDVAYVEDVDEVGYRLEVEDSASVYVNGYSIQL